MGSRARIAAAACVMATGLLVGGPCAATAFADPPSTAGSDDVSADQRQEKSPRRERPSDDAGPAADNADREPAAGLDAENPRRDVKTRSGGRGPGGGGEGENPRPPCCEDGSRDCGPGWPQPEDPSDSDGDYGENRPETVPPAGPMPPQGTQGRSDALDTVPGLGPNDATQAPINIPIVIARPTGLAPTAGPAGGAPPAAGATAAGSPAGPRQGSASPSSPRPAQPATAGSGAAMPASSYRLGYAEHLRAAGIPQLAVVALPGIAGILVLTGAGGLLGYRQAKAGQRMSPSGIARFMN